MTSSRVKLFTTLESYQVFETLYNGGLSWGTAFFTVGREQAVDFGLNLCEDTDVIAVFRNQVRDIDSLVNLWAVTRNPDKAKEVYERHNS